LNIFVRTLNAAIELGDVFGARVIARVEVVKLVPFVGATVRAPWLAHLVVANTVLTERACLTTPTVPAAAIVTTVLTARGLAACAVNTESTGAIVRYGAHASVSIARLHDLRVVDVEGLRHVDVLEAQVRDISRQLGVGRESVPGGVAWLAHFSLRVDDIARERRRSDAAVHEQEQRQRWHRRAARAV